MKFELSDRWFYYKCKELNLHKRIYIAFSGGIDSCVLFDLVKNLRKFENFNIIAIHIDHSQTIKSKNWVIFCKNLCEKNKIPIYVYTNKDNINNNNLEKQFRILRYIFFLKIIKKNSSLLLAHNKNDNIETILLNIFRGCGLDGIAGIKEKKKLNQINLIRPLLNISRTKIMEYAEKNKIDYIIDFSNFNSKFKRNYLRNEIINKIKNKWENFDNVVINNNKIYKNISYTINILNKNFLKFNNFKNNSISLKYLLKLPIFFCFEIIRIWIKRNNYLMPKKKKMEEINNMIFNQSNNVIKINNYKIIKYKKNIYIEKTKISRSIKIFLYNNINLKKNSYFLNKNLKINYKYYKIINIFKNIKYKNIKIIINNLYILKNNLIFRHIK